MAGLSAAERPLRTGVLGGTFDPPHLAHLALAQAAKDALDLNQVIFVVAGDPWRKAGRAISPASARVSMVQVAIEDLEWAGVSTIEVERSGPSYTAETLEALVSGGEPDEAWWFILGADALADMAYWHEPQRIIEHARLAVARRPDREGDPLVTDALRAAVPEIDAAIDLLPMPLSDLSATEIRARVASGQPTDEMMPEVVRELIDALGLYRP